MKRFLKNKILHTVGDFYLTFKGRVVGLWVIQFFPKLKKNIAMQKQCLLLALQSCLSQWKFEIALVEGVSLGEEVLKHNVLFKEKCTLADRDTIKDAISTVVGLRSTDCLVLMQHHISGRDNTLQQYAYKKYDFSTTSPEDMDQIRFIQNSLNVTFSEPNVASVPVE